MKTLLIQSGHPFWEKTISFARNCSWKAGPILASRMEKNDFQDWERVIIAIDHEAVVGYCTLSEKDELPVEYGFSPFIGFVFVDENHRGKRISEKMIRVPEEEQVLIENTHDAIVDPETWALAQRARKTKHRTDKTGVSNPLTGLVFCADCGKKMYNHRGKLHPELPNNGIDPETGLLPDDNYDCSTKRPEMVI